MPLKILLINEFGASDGAPTGWNLALLEQALKQKSGNLSFLIFSGLIRSYAPGGLTFARIFNLIWMYLALPFYLAFYRPSHILVMTSPPGIQIWTVLWSGLLKIVTSLWVMDMHPELEARFLDQHPPCFWLAALLRKIDAWALKKFEFVIVLDKAMEELIKEKVPHVDVIRHPIMLEKSVTPIKCLKLKNLKAESIRIVYAGNFGLAHDVNGLKLLAEYFQTKKINWELVSVGLNPQGIQAFDQLSQNYGFSHQKLNRKKPSELPIIFLDCNFGLVLMRESSKGIVSPSKFLNYISSGLPLIYAGPSLTNAHEACISLGAGIWVSSRNPNWPQEISLNLEDPRQYQKTQEKALLATDCFLKQTPDQLADEILKRWQCSSVLKGVSK